MKGALDAKYLIFIAKDGLGNRLLGLSSALAYAMLTDRILLMEWGNGWYDEEPANFLDLFEEPSMDMSISYGVFWDSLWSRWLYFLKIGTVESMNFDYACSDLRNDHSKYVWLKTTQYMAPIFLNNFYIKKDFHLWETMKNQYFTLAFGYLFKPRASILQNVNNFVLEHFPNDSRENTFLIGLQIRHVLGGDIHRFVECFEKYIWPLLLQDSPDSKSNVGVLNKNLAFFLATDDTSVVPNLRALLYPWKVFTFSETQVYRDSTSDIQRALIELILLGDCDLLLTTAESTFGYVAHSRTGRFPWLVFPNDQRCIQVNTSEPCFHGLRDHRPPCLTDNIGRLQC